MQSLNDALIKYHVQTCFNEIHEKLLPRV